MGKTNRERAEKLARQIEKRYWEILDGTGRFTIEAILNDIELAFDKVEKRGRKKERERWVEAPLAVVKERRSTWGIYGHFLKWDELSHHHFDAEKIFSLLGDAFSSAFDWGRAFGSNTFASSRARNRHNEIVEMLIKELGINED